MGLQVWLPLNGNLNNQGLSNVTVTNNGATVDDNGKIGKCYKYISTHTMISNIFSANPSELTICAWMKLDEGYTKNNGIHLIAMNSNELRICLSKDGAAVRVIYKYNNGGSAFS